MTADVFTNLAREGERGWRRPFGLRRLVHGVLRKIVHGATGFDLGSKKRTGIEESLEKSRALVVRLKYFCGRSMNASGENKLHTVEISNGADINSQHRLAGDQLNKSDGNRGIR